MDDKTYNILWIDDKHEEISGFKRTAKGDYGISLNCYKSFNSGISELEKNYALYDGILLDAKILENENDAEGTEDTKYIHRAKERILQLPKRFEIFVLTGQAKTYNSEEFNYAFLNVFEKGNDKDEDALFQSLIKAADKQPDTQIRHAYKRVFDVCTEKYIGEYAGQDLLVILRELNNSDVNKHFNTVRKVIEDMFSAFNKFQLLPNEFVNPTVSLNESSKFLMGKSSKGEPFSEKGFIHKEDTHLPKQISSYIWNILNTTQDGSHRASIDEHIKYLKTPYLLTSIVYQLLDVLVWFKKYIDSNPEKNNWTQIIMQNESDDSEKHKIIGTIQQDTHGNYYCGDYALNNIHTTAYYNVGDRIEIVESSNNTDHRTKGYYTKYANKFKRIVRQ